MTDFDRVKELFEQLKIPFTLGEREKWREERDLVCIVMTVAQKGKFVDGRYRADPTVIGGYDGAESRFLFRQDGSFVGVGIWGD